MIPKKQRTPEGALQSANEFNRGYTNSLYQKRFILSIQNRFFFNFLIFKKLQSHLIIL